jgi:hypothetical protein
MPWKADGTFERTNGPDPVFVGDDVWQDDQKASIKVIATRHDYHDEDLALGIANCLNLDGLNAMRADLDMGGFDLINLGTGEDEVKDGVWTPVMNVGMTPSGLNGGSWVRVGRFCLVMATIQWITQTVVDPLEIFTIEGLPFAIAPPNSGTDRQYLGSVLPLDGLNLADNTTYIFRSGIQRLGPNSIQPMQYWGTNDPPNTPPAEPNNQLVGIIAAQLESTGAFALNYLYLTNDAMPV